MMIYYLFLVAILMVGSVSSSNNVEISISRYPSTLSSTTNEYFVNVIYSNPLDSNITLVVDLLSSSDHIWLGKSEPFSITKVQSGEAQLKVVVSPQSTIVSGKTHYITAWVATSEDFEENNNVQHDKRLRINTVDGISTGNSVTYTTITLSTTTSTTTTSTSTTVPSTTTTTSTTQPSTTTTTSTTQPSTTTTTSTTQPSTTTTTTTSTTQPSTTTTTSTTQPSTTTNTTAIPTTTPTTTTDVTTTLTNDIVCPELGGTSCSDWASAGRCLDSLDANNDGVIDVNFMQKYCRASCNQCNDIDDLIVDFPPTISIDLYPKEIDVNYFNGENQFIEVGVSYVNTEFEKLLLNVELFNGDDKRLGYGLGIIQSYSAGILDVRVTLINGDFGLLEATDSSLRVKAWIISLITQGAEGNDFNNRIMDSDAFIDINNKGFTSTTSTYTTTTTTNNNNIKDGEDRNQINNDKNNDISSPANDSQSSSYSDMIIIGGLCLAGVCGLTLVAFAFTRSEGHKNRYIAQKAARNFAKHRFSNTYV